MATYSETKHSRSDQAGKQADLNKTKQNKTQSTSFTVELRVDKTIILYELKMLEFF